MYYDIAFINIIKSRKNKLPLIGSSFQTTTCIITANQEQNVLIRAYGGRTGHLVIFVVALLFFINRQPSVIII